MSWLKPSMRSIGAPSLTAILLTLLPISNASATDLGACRSLADDRARLSCYDALPLDAAPTAIQAAPPAPAISKEASFGRATVPLREIPKDEAEPDSITSKLVSLGTLNGKPFFRLENGQAWVSQDYDRITLKHEGDNIITIERSFFGYLLRVNDASGEISVQRVK